MFLEAVHSLTLVFSSSKDTGTKFKAFQVHPHMPRMEQKSRPARLHTFELCLLLLFRDVLAGVVARLTGEQAGSWTHWFKHDNNLITGI